jgi:hypothetical protein
MHLKTNFLKFYVYFMNPMTDFEETWYRNFILQILTGLFFVMKTQRAFCEVTTELSNNN